MSDTEPRTPVPAPEAAGTPGTAAIDLDREIAQLHASDVWKRGRAAKRLTSFRNFRVTLFALKPGVSLGEHHNAGRVTVQALRGRVRVKAGSSTFDLPPERLVILDRNVPHDVEAVEESAFLVSVAFEDRDQPA